MPLRDFLPAPERPGRVLIVDDDPLDQRMLAHQLKGEPFETAYADSGEAALDLCRAQAFEAILSDLSMPGMGGLEFCRRLRETPNANTPLVFLSGTPIGHGSIATWLEAGALDYLSKPCSQLDLVAKLRVMVRLSRQQAVLAASERHEALVEVAGGAAHELSQPLAAARLLLDRLERQRTSPTPEQMSQLRDFVDRTASILGQIKGLRTYVTKPYLSGKIMDIEKSHEASGHHTAFGTANQGGSE